MTIFDLSFEEGEAESGVSPIDRHLRKAGGSQPLIASPADGWVGCLGSDGQGQGEHAAC